MGFTISQSILTQGGTLQIWKNKMQLVMCSLLVIMFFFSSVIWFYLFSAVHPVAPANLSAVVHAWNATILWEWEYSSYSSFALVCEVEVTSSTHKTKVRQLLYVLGWYLFVICLDVQKWFLFIACLLLPYTFVWLSIY